MNALSKIKPKKFTKIWIGDFETTTTSSEYFKKYNKGRVIAFEVQELGNKDNYIQGCSMEEFEKWFLSLSDNHQIYFHNLGRFDAFVLLNWGLKHWYNKLSPNNSDIEFSYIKANSKIMQFAMRHRKKKITLVFNDSILLLLYSINNLGKLFKIPKLTTDYHIEPVDRLEDLPKDYLEYLHRDVEILNIALSQFAEDVMMINKQYNIDAGWNKMTMANLSRTLIRAVDVNNKYQISFRSQEKARDFYRGGYNALNKKIEDRRVKGDFIMIDAKSHYPSIMYLFELPAYEPVRISEEDIDKYKCVFVKVAGVIKRNKSNWATIPIKGEFDNYIHTQEERPFEFYGTYLEWTIQEKFYEFVKWHYCEIWGFEETQNLMNEVIKSFYELKETKEMNLTYKLFLNSMYGSCGMKANYPETFFAKIDEDVPYEFMNSKGTKGFVYSLQKNKCYFEGYKEVEYATRLPANVPCWNRWIAAYITSIGRYILQKYIALDPDNAMYCDTDSILISTKFPLDKIPQGRWLGEWGIDKKDIKEILCQGPKRYLLSNENGKTIKTSFAGLNKEIFKEDFESNVEIFESELVENGQRRVIISEEYEWFPLIIDNDYKNTRKVELNKRKNYEEKF